MVNRVLGISVVTIFAHLPLTAQNPQLHIQKNNEAVRIEGSESWLSFFEGNQGKAFMQNYQGDLYLGILTANPNGKIRFYNNNSTKMIIDPNGNVESAPMNRVQNSLFLGIQILPLQLKV